MKKLFLLVAFLGLFSSFSNLYARSRNWQSAYVIVNENDTLFGQVDFRTSRANQQQCVFRKNENSEVIIFSPDDILGYRFTPGGKFYVSKTVDINGFPERTFVEFMVKGMLNLYYFVDDNLQSHFLFEDENDRLFAITRRPDRIEDNRVVQDHRFDGILRYKFQDHPSITNHPERFEFNQRSMINLAVTYHNLVCPIGEECIIFENQRPDRIGIRTRFSVYTGLEQSMFRFSRNGVRIIDYDVVRIINQTPAFVLGMEMEFTRPQFSRNFGLYADFSVAVLNNEYDFTGERFPNLRDLHHHRKTNFIASLQTGIKYIYPTRKFSPVAKIGVSVKCLFGEMRLHHHSRFSVFEDYNTAKLYPGIHVALGSEYNLRNGQALSLYFTFDYHRMEQHRSPVGFFPVRFSSSLVTYGLRLGYIF